MGYVRVQMGMCVYVYKFSEIKLWVLMLENASANLPVPPEGDEAAGCSFWASGNSLLKYNPLKINLWLCISCLVSLSQRLLTFKRTSALAGHAWRYNREFNKLAFCINLRKLVVAQLRNCFRVTSWNKMTHASEFFNIPLILLVICKYIKISRVIKVSCPKYMHWYIRIL